MILGIDPGPEQSGWVHYYSDRIDPTADRVMESGVTDNPSLLDQVRSWPYPLVALEKIASYGMAVGASTFETVYWSGRFAEAHLSKGGTDVIRIPRIDVKMHLCHDSRAKDANIRQALIDRLGPPGTVKAPGPTHGVKSHAWAALAVAVTAADQLEGK